MHTQAIKVQKALAARGSQATVQELPESTRTASEAAQAVGCQVGQIVKSLVFLIDPPGSPVLFLVSGSNRLNESSVGERLNGRLSKASAAQVEEATGFIIGGVPPLGHRQTLTTYIDQDLLQYEVIWAAAGTSNAVFPIQPDELIHITGAISIPVI